MHLPPEAIHEFRAAWREDFGEELPFEKARVIAERFLWCVYEMMVIRESVPTADLTSHSDGGFVRE